MVLNDTDLAGMEETFICIWANFDSEIWNVCGLLNELQSCWSLCVMFITSTTVWIGWMRSDGARANMKTESSLWHRSRWFLRVSLHLAIWGHAELQEKEVTYWRIIFPRDEVLGTPAPRDFSATRVSHFPLVLFLSLSTSFLSSLCYLQNKNHAHLTIPCMGNFLALSPSSNLRNSRERFT